MKRIYYNYNVPANIGTEEEPVWIDQIFPKSLPYSEAALAIAIEEATNGYYTIEDDGTTESAAATDSEVLDALLGVTA